MDFLLYDPPCNVKCQRELENTIHDELGPNDMDDFRGLAKN